MFSVVNGVLAASVAPAASFVVGYPAGSSRGNFAAGLDHKMAMGQSDISEPEGMTLVFGAAGVTVTNASAGTWAAGSNYYFQFDRTGSDVAVSANGKELYLPLELVQVELGSPAASTANGIALSQAVAIAPALAVIAGALAANGVADLGLTGRNVVAAWTNAAIITVTGFDMHGKKMVEQSASGTALAGKKAFKTVTSISFNAAVTGVTVGTGEVLGLPVRLPSVGNVIRELENGATAGAGTLVAAQTVSTAATATTADVRGTYDAASACDGLKGFSLICALGDPANLGEAQYSV